jgi:hypothetical protein
MKWIKAILLSVGSFIGLICIVYYMGVKNPESILGKTIGDSFFIGLVFGINSAMVGLGVFIHYVGLRIKFVKE